MAYRLPDPVAVVQGKSGSTCVQYCGNFIASMPAFGVSRVVKMLPPPSSLRKSPRWSDTLFCGCMTFSAMSSVFDVPSENDGSVLWRARWREKKSVNPKGALAVGTGSAGTVWNGTGPQLTA